MVLGKFIKNKIRENYANSDVKNILSNLKEGSL